MDPKDPNPTPPRKDPDRPFCQPAQTATSPPLDQSQQEILRLTERLNSLESRLASSPDAAGAAGQPESVTVTVPTSKKVAPTPEEDGQRGSAEEEGEDKEVKLCESAWSLLAVVGLTDAGLLDVAFSTLLLLFNIVMQFGFIMIILDKRFLGSPFRDKVTHAQDWRTRSAHDYKYLDLADTSLVSRVCAEDDSLLVSSTQAKLIQDINKFLGLQKDDFEMPFWRPGVQLCMLCIILYNLCVFKELRTVFNSAQALLRVPRNGVTVMKGNSFKTISRGRIGVLMVAHVVRAVLAITLLISGVQWLASTTSIVDLILNAVALGGILEPLAGKPRMDEFIFVALVPTKIQLAVQKLEPMKVRYHQKRSDAESVVHCIMLLAAILLPWLILLEPISQDMLAVKKEMCSGTQNFVVSFNADVQMVLGYETYHARSRALPTLSEQAVRTFRFRSFDAWLPPGPGEFERGRLRKMKEEAAYYPVCFEPDVMTVNGSAYGVPRLTEISYSRMKTLAFQFDLPEGSTCEDFAQFCHDPEARLLRLMCGQTCGCVNPYSSPWYKQRSEGCGDFCLWSRMMANRQLPCRDLATAEATASWNHFWDNYFVAIGASWSSVQLGLFGMDGWAVFW
eukprot:g32047.t1